MLTTERALGQTGPLVLLVFLLLTSGTARSETLVVPDQFRSIQAAITSAVEGDTVLVRPGTYQEALAWANKNLTLLGEVLEPPVVITTASTSTVLSVGPGVTRQTVIEDITIRDGLAEDGGGMRVVTSAPAIHRCRFEANVAAVPSPGSGPSRGGALFASSGSSLVVTDCSFFQNQSMGGFPFTWRWGEGGAIYVESGGTLDVRRCRFEENEAWGAFEGGSGAGICLVGYGSAVIDSCAFEANHYAYGAGVWSEWHVAVNNCTFERNAGWGGVGVYAPYGAVSIENCLFLDNVVDGEQGGVITSLVSGSIANNTIAFNEGWNGHAGLWATEAVVANNIICGNQGWGVIGCPTSPQGFTCNDAWGNTINGQPANYRECDMTGVNGNISTDPLFCDAVARDLTIDAWSPCAPEHSPAGCGLIGALPVACVNPIGVTGQVAPPVAGRLRVTPNPMRGSGVIEWVSENGVPVSLRLYDPLGRLVTSRSLGLVPEGRQELRWDWLVGDRRLPPGVYLLELGGPAGGMGRARVIVIR